MFESGGEYMKEKMGKFRGSFSAFWKDRTRIQKRVFFGSIVILFLIIGLSFVTFSSKFVPLYNNLTLHEAGQIKEELDAKGIPYELEDGGTTIKVPEQNVDSLLIELAGQGIPKSGNTDYSFFSDNASWGITDNEFSMIKLDATQTELANLIKSIEGIADANVMINMPKESVFVGETVQEASASIVLDTKPGYQFKENQIEALYHLVSKAVPNLPQENIRIMNQHLEYFDENLQTATGDQESHIYQQTIKKDIERDIQRRLQQMLGLIVGTESVIVSVTADVDFTKENRIEELVDPVDLENMEGLPVSIETIHETYSGNPEAGGVVGTGEEDIPNYEALEDGDNGEYELVKETINNEFNRIHKEIVESPYKVRDLGIQVAVDNIQSIEGNNIQYLSQQEQDSIESGIASILNSVISTSIDKEYGEIIPDENVSIVFQPFNGATSLSGNDRSVIPLWMYIAGAISLVIIIILLMMLIRSRGVEEEGASDELVTQQDIEVPKLTESPETESTKRKKQLEKMASEKPEDFAKLLRSWISDD